MKIDGIKQAKQRVNKRRRRTIRFILILTGVFLIGLTAGSTACVLAMINCGLI